VNKKYKEKLEAAKSLIVDYVRVVDPNADAAPIIPTFLSGEDAPNITTNTELKAEAFEYRVKESGAITEEGLALLSHEDIGDILVKAQVSVDAVPKVLAKQVAGVFRSSESKSGCKSGYVSSRKAEAMTLRELLEAYDPLDPDNSVGSRLKSLSGGKPFLVFNYDAKSLNVDDSLFLLEEVRAGYNPRQHYNGEPVCKVGDVGVHLCVNENPLFPGRPLRSDGTCDMTNRSWKGVSLETEQLASLIDLSSESSRKAGVTANTILDIVEVAGAKDGFKRLGDRFPEALVKFNTLKREGKLPSLQVYLNPLTKKPTSLFSGGKKVS